jgi:hypothetical protein
MSSTNPPFTQEQLERLYRDAEEKRGRARADMAEAARREQEAAREQEAYRTLAHIHFGVDFSESADATSMMTLEGVEARMSSILQLMIDHFRRHPEPATATEIAEAIHRETGRPLHPAAITTTRDRNTKLFKRLITPDGKRAFVLRGGPSDVPSSGGEG